MIIRHGQSEGNAANLMQGREEFALSETGRLQAAARGRSLNAALHKATGKTESGAAKTLLFSSPQSRARETAGIIAEEAGLAAPVCLESLIEMELGIWSGKNWSFVQTHSIELWTNFQSHSWDAIPGAESSAALYDRALCAWASLRDAAIEQDAANVIAVTHGGFIQWLLKTTLDCRTWYPLFPIANCSVSRLHAEPRPATQSAFLCWEEISTPLQDLPTDPRGFPS